jgi:murein DD-endopeptidase / murein LD-carboxypeptidase
VILMICEVCIYFSPQTSAQPKEDFSNFIVVSAALNKDSGGNRLINEAILLQKKYAAFLNVSPERLTNIKLYAFIDQWMNTPYKWGGTDENGIDCSAFLQRLFEEVYDLKLPRTSIQQLMIKYVEPFRSQEYLSEGDIVFFNTIPGKLVSHVGIYLQNGVFINASSSKGVSFGNLNDRYWKKQFVAAGRVNMAMAKR